MEAEMTALRVTGDGTTLTIDFSLIGVGAIPNGPVNEVNGATTIDYFVSLYEKPAGLPIYTMKASRPLKGFWDEAHVVSPAGAPAGERLPGSIRLNGDHLVVSAPLAELPKLGPHFWFNGGTSLIDAGGQVSINQDQECPSNGTLAFVSQHLSSSATPQPSAQPSTSNPTGPRTPSATTQVTTATTSCTASNLAAALVAGGVIDRSANVPLSDYSVKCVEQWAIVHVYDPSIGGATGYFGMQGGHWVLLDFGSAVDPAQLGIPTGVIAQLRTVG